MWGSSEACVRVSNVHGFSCVRHFPHHLRFEERCQITRGVNYCWLETVRVSEGLHAARIEDVG